MRIPVRRELAPHSMKRGDHEVTIIDLDEFYEMMIWLNMYSET